MVDPTIITKIAAAGAMGVSIFCILKVYDLLKNEQKKDFPRSNFLKTIYVSMGFAVIMTLLSLVIELVRNHMDNELEKLRINLENVEKRNYYIVDDNMDTENVEIIFKQDTFNLCQEFPEKGFINNELKVEKRGDGKYTVYKDNASKIIELGYISEIEIRNKINDLLIDKNNKTNPHELYSLGLCYTPMEILNGLEIKNVEENRYKAIQYLLELINRNTDQNIKKRKNEASKILANEQIINLFGDEDYDKLIEALKHGVRPVPFGKYDLAQVYLRRSRTDWAEQDDVENYYKCLKGFISSFETSPVLMKDSIGNIQYLEAIKIIEKRDNKK